MIEFALIGTAHIHTPAYIDVINSRPDARVARVWDHVHDRARGAADRLGAAGTDRVEDIWSDPAIAGVIICTETNRHVDVLDAAIDAGKVVFVEKPMTPSWPEADAIAGRIVATGTIFQTGYFLRYYPSILALRQAVQDGSFGHVNRIHARLSHPGALDSWFDSSWQWRADPTQAGPDAFHDLAIHLVDLLAWIGGADRARDL